MSIETQAVQTATRDYLGTETARLPSGELCISAWDDRIQTLVIWMVAESKTTLYDLWTHAEGYRDGLSATAMCLYPKADCFYTIGLCVPREAISADLLAEYDRMEWELPLNELLERA